MKNETKNLDTDNDHYQYLSDKDDYQELTWIDWNDDRIWSVGYAVRKYFYILASIGLIFNLINLFFLSRKELRSDFIFIIMTGICVGDILIVTFPICQKLFDRTIDFSTIDYTDNNLFPCNGLPYQDVLIELIGRAIQASSRKCSALLAFFMTFIRTISVIFPMSHLIRALSTPKSALITITGLATICGCWEARRYIFWRIEKEKKCKPVKPGYQFLSVEDGPIGFYHLFDGYFMTLISFSYLFITSKLIMELRKVNRRRRSLKKEKADDTLKLMIVMNITFFISAFFSGIFYLFDVYFLAKYPMLQ